MYYFEFKNEGNYYVWYPGIFQNLVFNMPSRERNLLAKLAKKRKEAREAYRSVENMVDETPPHLSSFPTSSKEEILFEFMSFLRNFPVMIESEKNKIINCVKESFIIWSRCLFFAFPSLFLIGINLFIWYGMVFSWLSTSF